MIQEIVPGGNIVEHLSNLFLLSGLLLFIRYNGHGNESVMDNNHPGAKLRIFRGDGKETRQNYKMLQ
jgi:hypothetical protein